MNNKDIDKALKNSPYYRYENRRTVELFKRFMKSLKAKDKSEWIKYIGGLCYQLALTESQVIQNQAVLNDPSQYRNHTRDDMLKMFGKTFINGIMKRNNDTYGHFDKSYMNIKDGDKR